jgi:hypothetical protein
MLFRMFYMLTAEAENFHNFSQTIVEKKRKSEKKYETIITSINFPIHA